MIEVFMELIDSLYYPGYAEEIAIDNPEKFAFEFSEFLENIGSGLTS